MTVLTGQEDNFIYEMEKVQGFGDLTEKIIVAWKNAISWYQYITNEMEVIEIHQSLHYRQFTNYFDFKELQEIINNGYR